MVRVDSILLLIDLVFRESQHALLLWFFLRELGELSLFVGMLDLLV